MKEQDTSPEQTAERGDPMDHPGGNIKIPRPTQVSVVIREADSHYLVTFDHGSRKRVFHNVEELLVAIEVKVKRLGGTLGGG